MAFTGLAHTQAARADLLARVDLLWDFSYFWREAAALTRSTASLTTIEKGSIMAVSHPISVDVLRQLIRLDPETGLLFWRERGPEWFQKPGIAPHWNSLNAGKPAFNQFHPLGPDGVIDHINRDKGDNRPGNLRDVTHRANSLNNVKNPNSTSAYRGVSWDKARSKWAASIRGMGRQKNLGLFESELDAARAYDAAAPDWHGELARLNFPG